MVEAAELRIVSSNNVEILRHTSQVQLRRSGVVHSVGSSMAELRALIAKESPTLVIIEATLDGGNGFDLCREIKKDETLSRTQVIVAYQGILSAEDVARSASSGCNDVMVLPLHSDDFYCHVSQVTGVSWRDSLRVDVNLKVRLDRGDQIVHGAVVNVAPMGLGLRVASELSSGPISVTIEHSEGNFHGIAAEVVWCNPSDAGGFAVGIRLLEVPPLARGLLTRLSLFQVTKNEAGDGITVAMQGVFDENTDFRPLLEHFDGQGFVDFAMQGITYLSSDGVSAWCRFLSEVNPKLAYSFRNCSVAFVAQASIVPMAIGRGTVLSVQAPYLCERCGREETRLVESALVRQKHGPVAAPALHCHVCNHKLSFDDLPERYFAFLMD